MASSSSSSSSSPINGNMKMMSTFITSSAISLAFRRESVKALVSERLQKRAETKRELLKAIERSMISAIIFSKRYPFSESCMQQLAKIMECQKEYQIVIPVFYEVLPSDVRWQEGSFGEAFAVHKKNLMPGLDKFKANLVEASNLAGWDSKATSFLENNPLGRIMVSGIDISKEVR